MTERQANRWKGMREWGVVIYCVFQAVRCFGLFCGSVALPSLLFSQRLPDFWSILPIAGLLAVIWGFFAIGLWHKHEYAYLRHTSHEQGLSSVADRS